MDTTTRTLLVEVARTVLRVLAADQPTPWATAVNREADKGAPPPVNSKAAVLERLDKKATATAGVAQRGDTVRFWDGNRYSIGTVQNICRKKVGQPASVTVRVERGEGRKGKTHKIEAAKAEVLKGAA